MTERGLPIVDGAPACPFVAFEDDRDERATAPDHRHRCYAESQPAPRALAHQEAYCLSSAFPVCPTFQDWARREAARSRGESSQSLDSVAAAAANPSSQRNPPRNWAEPPPWSARSGSGTRPADASWDDEDEADDSLIDGTPAEPPVGQGLSGSYADRVASAPGLPDMGVEPELEPEDDEEDDVPVGNVPPYAPSYPPPATAPATRPGHERRTPEPWDADAADDDEGAPEPSARRRRERDPELLAGVGTGAPRAAGAPRIAAAPGAAGGAARHERRRDPNAPEWERARPLEAFPTLRSRRLPELSIPPILVAVVALAIAAAVLFALPGLLGFGSPAAGGSAAPSTPTRTPLVSLAPTAVPVPTDQLYIVQAGDTMSRIAGRFGIALGDLIAANAETIPDPDNLAIGDQVIIPGKNPDELPAASEIPAAT